MISATGQRGLGRRPRRRRRTASSTNGLLPATLVLPRLEKVLLLGVNTMREQFTVMTRKGQVTVPVQIRRALGLREGDKVAFTLDDGHVKLTRAHSIVEQTAGILRSSQPA